LTNVNSGARKNKEEEERR